MIYLSSSLTRLVTDNRTVVRKYRRLICFKITYSSDSDYIPGIKGLIVKREGVYIGSRARTHTMRVAILIKYNSLTTSHHESSSNHNYTNTACISTGIESSIQPQHTTVYMADDDNIDILWRLKAQEHNSKLPWTKYNSSSNSCWTKTIQGYR